jgi:hypothetical protein
LKTAAAWGCELAADPDVTADQAREIILQWDRERIASIECREHIRERIENLLAFAVLGLAILAGLGFWIWKITRPII